MRYRVLSSALLMALAIGVTHAQGTWQPLPDTAPAPADNPTTAAKVELGKMLYFDPRLSSTGTVSCFSCHNVMEGGDDHMTTSAGVHGLKGGRNAPTVWNSAFHSVQFWDGRAPSLEEQAKGPPVNPIEMGMANLDAVNIHFFAGDLLGGLGLGEGGERRGGRPAPLEQPPATPSGARTARMSASARMRV